MSGYGAIINNDKGQRIIEENEVGYVFYRKMSATVVGDQGFWFDTGVPLGWEPMIFVRCKNYTLSGGNPSSGCRYTTHFKQPNPSDNALQFVKSWDNGSSITYDFYIFVPAQYMNAGSWGLKIMDKNGRVVFHSGRTNLVIEQDIDYRTDDNKQFPWPIAICGQDYRVYGNYINVGMGIDYSPHWNNKTNFFARIAMREFGSRTAFGDGSGPTGASFEKHDPRVRNYGLNFKAYAIKATRYDNIPNARLEDIHEDYREDFKRAMKTAGRKSTDVST